MVRYLRNCLFLFLFCFAVPAARAQLTADFYTTDSAGCAPYLAHFINTTTGTTSGTTYFWDMGNGNTYSLKDVSVNYMAPGTYTVTLTATDGAASSTKSMVVRIYSPPTVGFSASKTKACVNEPITFTSSTTSGAWGGLTYQWNFGNGSSTTTATPSYSYTTPGYYNITLLAENAAHCRSSLTKSSYINITIPPASSFYASGTQFCSPPATTNFNNTSTGITPVGYEWYYGDGGYSIATSPSYTYITTGAFSVKLITTDGNGCKDSITKPAYVTIGKAKASFSAPANACGGNTVTFTNTSAPHLSSYWDFGNSVTSTNENDNTTYNSTGAFVAKLIIYDGFCYDTAAQTIFVSTPSGSLVDSQLCSPRSTFSFTANLTPGTSLSSWNFGGSSTSTSNPAIHQFLSPIFNVTLNMVDTAGCTASVSKMDTVRNLMLQIAAFDQRGCVNRTVNFTPLPVFQLGMDYYSYNYPVTACIWDFGDGTPSSSAIYPAHIYTTTGKFNARCHATTANGCTIDTFIEIQVGSIQTPSFTMSATHVCPGAPIVYRSTSTNDTLIDNYYWVFDDGDSRTGQFDTVVTHKSHFPGEHSPHLFVYYNGCVCPTPYSLKDTIDSPGARIEHAYLCTPQRYQFIDTSWGDDTHLWIFSDGTTSTIRNPIAAPNLKNGSYAILTTYNIGSGCRDTSSKYYIENLGPPHMNMFTFCPTNICRDKVDTIYSSVCRPPLGGDSIITSYDTYDTTGGARTYKWYDNGTFVGTNPTLLDTFRAVGSHSLTLIVEDNHGCLDTLTRNNFILTAKPTAKFTSSFVSGCAPVVASFKDISSASPGSSLYSYEWDFGDGNMALMFGPSTTHSYTSTGTYTIKEVVTDNIGCMDTVKGISSPVVHAPIADFTASDISNCIGTPVGFANGSSSSTAWLWSFGDGATSTATSPVHTYTAAGTYNVSLTAFDGFGCSNTNTKTGYMTINPLPKASFYMDDTFVICPPLSVNFFNTSTGSTAFQWDFGDGTFSNLANPGEIYSLAGRYKIKLVSSNQYGCIDSAIGHVSTAGYKGAFTYSPSLVCKGGRVHFSCLATGAAKIVWDFGDGTITAPSTDTISYAYTVPGKYLPKLYLTDSSGCLEISDGADSIAVDTLIPNFTYAPTPGCQFSPVTFNDSSYSYYSKDAQWTWSFGSGATSTLSKPDYTFTVSGTFPVTLNVTDSAGCSSVITKNVSVNVGPPAITGSPFVCNGSTTSLSDITLGGTWTSSNTTVANVAGGLVTAVNPGTSVITYALSNGCKATITATVGAQPATINGTTYLCAGSTTKLNTASTGGTWSSSNTAVATVGSSGTVSGIAGGTVTISYTFASGCASVTTVTVNPLPSVISGVTKVCRGETTTLSDADAGGTWTSANTMIATVGSSSGVVTGGTLTGTTIISYTLGTGCATGITVSVNPLPQPVSGKTAVCSGAQGTLSDATPGGAWSSGNTTIASIGTSGVYTGSSTGTSVITYALPTGCLSTQTVTIYALPNNISGPGAVCVGSTITLSNTSALNSWTSGNTAVAAIGASTGIVSGITQGTATITFTMAGTNCITTTVTTVNPLPAAITGTTSVCENATAKLSDGTPGGSWNSTNTSIATITGSGIYTGISAGTVAIQYVSGAGCKTSQTITVIAMPVTITGNMNVCLGIATTLSNGVSGGTWYSANTAVATVGSTSGIVNTVAAGTATISYTINSMCATSSKLTVYAPPSPIKGKNEVCVGASITLTDATAGGTWSSGNTTIATVGSANGTVTGFQAGTAKITYTSSFGCTTDTIVKVDPLPQPITGVNQVCVNASISLSSLSGGGTWISANVAVATIDLNSGVVNGIRAGTSSITYTLPTGCFITGTLTVNPLPANISGNKNVCVGLTTQLSDADPGGAWTSSRISIATVGTAGLISGITAGTSSITYQLPTGCRTSATVTVNPLPGNITGPSEVCAGSAITMSNATNGGSWSVDNTLVAGINSSGTLSGIAPGTAVVTYKLPTSCMASRTVTVDPLPATISGLKNICLNDQVTLSDASPGGTWSSSSTSISISSSTGLVKGLTPGSATVTYTLLTGCLRTATLAVYPLPDKISTTDRVCLGLTITLSDASPGGSWQSSDITIATVSSAGVVKGMSVGTATITYKLPTSCFVTAPVIVNRLPSVIAGRRLVCVADTVMLTDSVAAGTWTSSDPGIATIDASGVVTGVSGGTTSITYTTPDGCDAYTSVSVNPLIKPVTGYTRVCVGATITLSSLTQGGTWSVSDPSVATVAAGVVKGITVGTVTITYKAANVCGEALAVITVDPLPDAGYISGNKRVCTGSSFSLTDTIKNGVWSVYSNGVAQIDTNGVVTGILSGTTLVTYSYTNSCGTAHTQVVVTVNPTPAVAHITTHPDTVQCSSTRFQNFGADAPAPAGIQYVWQTDHATLYATGNTKQYCLISFDQPGRSVIRLSSNQLNTECQSYDSLVFHIGDERSPDPSVVYYSPEFVCNDNTARSYQWGYDDVQSLDSTILQGMVNQNYYDPDPSLGARYYWVMTYHGNCLQKSYFNLPTAIGNENIHDGQILLYPNPAGDLLNMEIKGLGAGAVVTATIYDVLGKERTFSSLHNGKAAIPLSGYVPGVYMVVFHVNGVKLAARSFVKE